MPNWCMNYATINNDDTKVIEQVSNAAQGEKFFGNFFPVEPNGGQYPLPGQEEWGTKWDIGSEDIYIIEQTDNSIRMSFGTAWSPPTAFYDKFVKKFGGSIEASYCEPGVGFIGEYVSGETDDCYELRDPNVPESLKDEYSDVYESIEEEEEGEN